MLSLKQMRWTGGFKEHLQAWTSDRSRELTEGERLLEEGDYAGAELLLARAQLVGERRRFPFDMRIQIRLELAEAQRQQPGRLDAATKTAESALEIARFHGDKTLLVHCLDFLAQVFADGGDLETMEAFTREAIEIEQHLRRPNVIVMARRIRRLGVLRLRAGQVSAAIPALEEAVRMYERLCGPEHVETASLLTELGDAHRFLGQHSEAQKYLLHALRIHERECGTSSAEAVHDLSLLTGSYESSGDLDSAAAQNERVLGLKLRAVGASLDEIAEAQSSLALLHMRWGNASRARELLMEALGTFKRLRGPRYAATFEALAAIDEQCGHLADALRQLTCASQVWETLQPAHSQELLRNLEYQAQLLEQLRRKEDAAYVRGRLAEVAHATRWAAAS